jgi:hypothetical protein
MMLSVWPDNLARDGREEMQKKRERNERKKIGESV